MYIYTSDKRQSEYVNIYKKIISINDDPDFHKLISPHCGSTCIDLTDLKEGIKVSHLERLFPYLEKHLDRAHNEDCAEGPNGEKGTCPSITRKELKKLVKKMDWDKNGELSLEEFCAFLSEMDSRVKSKCQDPDAVLKVLRT